LSLDDPSVSRRHVVVRGEATGFWVEDLGSRNGTLLNGVALKRGRLQLGDRLDIGSVPLRFDMVTLEELGHLQAVVERLEARDRDPLTGLLTRAYLEEQLPEVLERCAREGKPASAVFADVDHFKGINDRYGHGAGDEVLRQLSRVLAFITRDGESCVRYGGEEIVVVLEDADEERAAAVAERIRQAIAAYDWAQLGLAQPVTLSCGTAERGPGEPIDGWLDRADKALYAAKHGGRNQVRRASQLGAAGG